MAKIEYIFMGFLIFVSFILLIISVSKFVLLFIPNSNMGPKGPMGPISNIMQPGPQGPTGPPGPQGYMGSAQYGYPYTPMPLAGDVSSTLTLSDLSWKLYYFSGNISYSNYEIILNNDPNFTEGGRFAICGYLNSGSVTFNFSNNNYNPDTGISAMTVTDTFFITVTLIGRNNIVINFSY